MRPASIYFISAAFTLLALTGCSGRENEPDIADNDSPSFTAVISDVRSRAFDNSWEANDEIGITGSGSSNICYVTTGGNGFFTVKSHNEQIYYQNEAEQTFTAYYPWTDLAEGAITISSDTRLQASQKSFDFLWAQATGKKSAPEVSFTFSHRMTRLVLTVKPGTGMSYNEIKSTTLSLSGFSSTGSFNITDGSTTVGSVGEAWDFTEFARANDAEQTLTFSLILFPQTLANPLDFKAVLKMVGDVPLNLWAPLDFTSANSTIDGDNAGNEWVAGRQYNLSVTLNKTDLELDRFKITAWNEVEGEELVVD